MVDNMNFQGDLLSQLKISNKAKRLLLKMNITNLNDISKVNVQELLYLVSGNQKIQSYVDELWEYVHANNKWFDGEEMYLKMVCNLMRQGETVKISELFMSRNARRFLENYLDIDFFLQDLGKSKRLLKSFLCLVVANERDDYLEKLLAMASNKGAILSIIISDFKQSMTAKGELMPLFCLIKDRPTCNCLARSNYWLVGDLLALSKNQIETIPGLGNVRFIKILECLKNNGFILERPNAAQDLALSYKCVSILKLHFSLETTEKLLSMQVTNLEQLLNLDNLDNLTNNELREIREKVFHLGFSFDDKFIAMSDATLQKRYTRLADEQEKLSERLSIINKETVIYKRLLTLKNKN